METRTSLYNCVFTNFSSEEMEEAPAQLQEAAQLCDVLHFSIDALRDLARVTVDVDSPDSPGLKVAALALSLSFVCLCCVVLFLCFFFCAFVVFFCFVCLTSHVKNRSKTVMAIRKEEKHLFLSFLSPLFFFFFFFFFFPLSPFFLFCSSRTEHRLDSESLCCSISRRRGSEAKGGYFRHQLAAGSQVNSANDGGVERLCTCALDHQFLFGF